MSKIAADYAACKEASSDTEKAISESGDDPNHEDDCCPLQMEHLLEFTKFLLKFSVVENEAVTHGAKGLPDSGWVDEKMRASANRNIQSAVQQFLNLNSLN